MENEKFDNLCRTYCKQRLPLILNKFVMERIQCHKNNNDKTLIVSASVSNWIAPWAVEHGFQSVIATELENINGILTGKFGTENCYGKTKVSRLLKEYPNRNSYILYAYGNSRGDMELIDFADKGWYKNKYIK
jgi:HAD superfamily phosphoserine phosphatase-like hydrolase